MNSNKLGASVQDYKNRTFCILFLKVKDGRSAKEVGCFLIGLWKMLNAIRRDVLNTSPRGELPLMGLDLLIGYGQKIFDLEGAKKSIPRNMFGMQFSDSKEGQEPIIQGSGIRFAPDVHDNLGISEHIVLQFISTTQLASYLAVKETWRYIARDAEAPITFTKFFTGFQRYDRRSWLGFHDEISNLRNIQEIRGVIGINKKWNHLSQDDLWTEKGTYIAFLRIGINLTIWEGIGQKQQELLVGRSKISGKPIIAVNKKGNPIFSRISKLDKLASHDVNFLDHPNYFKGFRLRSVTNPNIDVNASLKSLNLSHIGRTRHIDKIDCRDPSSNRIFRQGFEFVELSSNPIEPVQVGLNFVSFQNDPKRLFSLLASPHWMGNSNFGGVDDRLDGLLSVKAAGIFFVPPSGHPFPGHVILI